MLGVFGLRLTYTMRLRRCVLAAVLSFLTTSLCVLCTGTYVRDLVEGTVSND